MCLSRVLIADLLHQPIRGQTSKCYNHVIIGLKIQSGAAEPFWVHDAKFSLLRVDDCRAHLSPYSCADHRDLCSSTSSLKHVIESPLRPSLSLGVNPQERGGRRFRRVSPHHSLEQWDNIDDVVDKQFTQIIT